MIEMHFRRNNHRNRQTSLVDFDFDFDLDFDFERDLPQQHPCRQRAGRVMDHGICHREAVLVGLLSVQSFRLPEAPPETKNFARMQYPSIVSIQTRRGRL